MPVEFVVIKLLRSGREVYEIKVFFNKVLVVNREYKIFQLPHTKKERINLSFLHKLFYILFNF